MFLKFYIEYLFHFSLKAKACYFQPCSESVWIRGETFLFAYLDSPLRVKLSGQNFEIFVFRKNNPKMTQQQNKHDQ